MTKNKTNKLVQALLENDKSYDKVNPLVIDDKTTILYAEKLGHKDIDSMMEELMLTQNYATLNKLEYPVSGLEMIEHLQYLTFKYTTELREALDDSKEYYLNIQASHNAYDRGWMKKFDEIVNIEVIVNVFDKFYQIIDSSIQFDKMDKEAKEELLKQVQNKKQLAKLLS